MTQEPALTSAYWHDEFIDIKNPHKKDEFLRVPLNRAWVGLTQEELCEIVGVSTSDSDWNVYKVQEWLRKVEAKLKEKNA